MRHAPRSSEVARRRSRPRRLLAVLVLLSVAAAAKRLLRAAAAAAKGLMGSTLNGTAHTAGHGGRESLSRVAALRSVAIPTATC